SAVYAYRVGPSPDLRQLVMMGEIQPQRRDGRHRLLSGTEVGVVCEVGGTASRTDPVYRLAVGGTAAHRRLRRMALAQPRDLQTGQLLEGHGGNVHVQQHGRPKGRRDVTFDHL